MDQNIWIQPWMVARRAGYANQLTEAGAREEAAEILGQIEERLAENTLVNI